MKNSTKFLVRFNLGAGVNFMKWKLTYPSGYARYFDPATHSILLTGCKLRNSPATALKIFNGQNKTVCAWIEADSFEVRKTVSEVTGTPVMYNPRVCPNWVADDMNADNKRFKSIVTTGRRLTAI